MSVHAPESHPSAAVYVAAAVALLFWAGTPVATKAAVATIDPVSVGILRSIVAGIVAAVLAVSMRLPFPRTGADRALLVISGVASFAVWPALMSFGLGFTNASHAGLIIALIPIVTGLFAAALERRWPHAKWCVGGAIALAGTAALILSRSGAGAEDATLFGDLVIVAGVFSCATGYVAGGRLSARIGGRSTTFWGLACTAALLIPVSALVAHRTDWAAVSTTGWLSLAYLALLGTLGAYFAWFWALGRGGLTRVSAWQLVQPVITLFLAALLLGEAVTFVLLASAAVIVGGTGLAQARREA